MLDLSSCLDAVTKAPYENHGGDCGCVIHKAEIGGSGGETVEKDDTFIKEELALAALMLLGWNTAVAATGIQEMLRTAAKTGNRNTLLEAADKAAFWVDDTYDEYTDKQKAKEEIDKTILIGLLIYGSQEIYDRIYRSRDFIRDGALSHIQSYANSYFQRIVHPSLVTASGAAPADMLAVVDAALQRGVLDTAPYWRTVANAEDIRAHHYGILRGAQEGGYRGYRFVAVMDERTTQICRNMHGREFIIADVLEVMENMSWMDIFTLRQTYGWPRNADAFANLTNREIMARGWAVPPLHGRCRSTLRPIR